MGLTSPRSTVLSAVEEAVIVEFRCRTLLPLDDVLGCLRDTIPRLTRSSLHRCLERHGISRLPPSPDQASPYAIHAVLTDNDVAFADLPKNRGRHPELEAMFGGHIFDRVCRDHAIRHRLTKPYHPWTNGQAERMNRTIKNATIKAFHYADPESLKAHVLAFVSAYNFVKHLKALRWRTPFEAVCHAWTNKPEIFKPASPPSRDQTFFHFGQMLRDRTPNTHKLSPTVRMAKGQPEPCLGLARCCASVRGESQPRY